MNNLKKISKKKPIAARDEARAAAEEAAAAYADELRRLECARLLLEEELGGLRARERTQRVEKGRVQALEAALDTANRESESLRKELAQAKTKIMKTI
jgi:hypothetical protein